MKLGIAMLVVGLFMAAFGVFLWKASGSEMLFGPYNSLRDLALYAAAGQGLGIFGGGLAIGGIVRMAVTRK